MSSTMSRSQRFLLEDSSSSDDSDINEMILDDDVEQAMVIVAVKNLQDRMAMKRRRRSIPGRITVLRNRATNHEALMQDYFVEVPKYPSSLFRRRYQMRRELFVKIMQACEANCRYFTHRRNRADTLGFNPYQKILAAMRVIAYGIPADYTDEYLCIGEDTTILSVRLFAKTIIHCIWSGVPLISQ
jgi:L-lysine 2,3-aminomutase